MTVHEYFEQIYYDVYSDIEENIELPIDKMKVLYENRKINIIRLQVKQRFAYNIADLAMEGKCKLVDKYWLSNYRYGEPKFDNGCGKYGDLMNVDGSHIVKRDIGNSINVYRIIIQVKDDSEWVFEFDRENQESMNSFYKLFYNYLYDDYIKLLIKKRVEEINKIEIDNLKRISQEILKENE